MSYDGDTKITLPLKPRLSNSYYRIPMMSNELQLRNEERAILLEGRIVSTVFPRLIPLLEGNLTLEEIVGRLKDIDKDIILDILYKLNRFRLLEDASIGPPDDIPTEEIRRYDLHIDLFSQFNVNKYEPQRFLKHSKVGIVGLGMMGFQIAELLALSGIGHLDGIDPNIVSEADIVRTRMFSEHDAGKPRAEVVKVRCDRINPFIKYKARTDEWNSAKEILTLFEGLNLVIVAEDAIRPNIYDWINEACIELGIKWTSCGSHGLKGFIGPTVVPRQTACYKCFELRLNSNIQYYREFLAFKEYLSSERVYHNYGKLLMFFGMISNTMVMEVIKLLTNTMPPTTLGRQMMFDFLNMSLEFHDVLRLPRCPACGLPSKERPTTSPWAE